MDAERDQAGAERERGRQHDLGRGLRCPECGRAASADVRHRKAGFWADPVRWMPAVLLVLLVGFQLATPLVLPGRVETVQSPVVFSANDPYQYARHPAWFGQTITWEEIERAAKGSAREIEMMVPLVEQITTADHYLTWKGMDPAARIALADGWIADNSDRGFRREPWMWLGLFDTWLQGEEFHGPYPVPTSWSWSMAYFPLPGNAPGYRWLAFDRYTLTFIVVQSALGVACLRVVARPLRKGFRRAWFRSPWVWLTIVISMTLAGIPTSMGPHAGRVQSNPLQPSSFTSWQLTGITLEQLRARASGSEPAVSVARALVEARSRRTKAEAERQPWSNPGQWVACITAVPQTPVNETYVTMGWPDAFAQYGLREKSKPEGVKETTGRLRLIEPSRFGFTLSTNSGAWPGRSTWMRFESTSFSFVLVLTLTTWWLFRAVLRSRLLFRGRKRALRGLCVGCGYDLKGLRGRGAATP